ncbi:MAG: hypothetical protein IAE89_01445 [Anaerolineae bacterium]|nr:hypothetical protein [Anaerolineae bacterium]
MAYSNAPVTTLSRLIETLQAACLKCQSPIPDVAPAIAESSATIQNHGTVSVDQIECPSDHCANLAASADDPQSDNNASPAARPPFSPSRYDLLCQLAVRGRAS